MCKGVCGEAPQRRLADWSEEEVAPLLEEGVHLGLRVRVRVGLRVWVWVWV